MNFQKKFFDVLTTEAEKRGFDLVDNAQWANTGRAYIQPKGEFKSVLTFSYEFYDAAATVQIYSGNTEPKMTCGFTDPTCLRNARFSYTETDKINDIIGYIVASLPAKEHPCSLPAQKQNSSASSRKRSRRTTSASSTSTSTKR